MELRDKQYLGDGVYVQHDGSRFVLTTEDGYGEQNWIVLEPEVCAALVEYVAAQRAKAEGR